MTRSVGGQNCGRLWPVHVSRKRLKSMIQHFVFVFLSEGRKGSHFSHFLFLPNAKNFCFFHAPQQHLWKNPSFLLL